MTESDRQAERARIAEAQERGWITLEEVMGLASGSPVDLADAKDLVREAGIDLVGGRGDGWEDVEALADEGPAAFVVEPEEEEAAEVPALDDITALYLNEIGQTRLLTAQEEVQLAKELDAGKAAQKRLANRAEYLEPAERARLEQAVRTCEAARERLIQANLRLVVSVARKYANRGLSFLDLVQEGNLGLQHAVDKFDWRKGFRFSTYAHWWIRQAISRAVAEQSRIIRLPTHVVEQLGKLYSASRALTSELGREPTTEEIAQRLGVEPEKVEQAFRAARVPISLDVPVGEEEEATIADLIADAGPTPDEEAEEEMLSEALERTLKEHLNEREVQVLRLRFGLGGEREHTLAEIGRKLGITRERARQIEAEAMLKLRSLPQFNRQFRSYAA